jgi:CheY-like chemotaxis protein
MSKSLRDTKIHMLKPGTILLVDDDQPFRTEIKEILQEENYDAVALESANHAIRYVQAQPWTWYPWLVITDLVMDGMGGYQLMRRMHELYPNKDIPMIVVSRLGSAEDVNEAEMAGATAYLRKPISPEKLLDTIKKVTSKKKDPTQLKTTSKEI